MSKARDIKIIIWGFKDQGELRNEMFSSQEELMTFVYNEFFLGNEDDYTFGDTKSDFMLNFDKFMDSEDMELVKIELDEYRNYGGDDANEVDAADLATNRREGFNG